MALWRFFFTLFVFLPRFPTDVVYKTEKIRLKFFIFILFIYLFIYLWDVDIHRLTLFSSLQVTGMLLINLKILNKWIWLIRFLKKVFYQGNTFSVFVVLLFLFVCLFVLFFFFLSDFHWAFFFSMETRKKKNIKLVTVVESDLKAPFSIATTLRCRGGCSSFPWIAPLYTWSFLYNAEC